MVEKINLPHTSIHRIEADGLTVFYREAGPADAPTVRLLHGFPTSSFQYRELIPRLADRYRVIAPDLPGFAFTEVPEKRQYRYTFDALANMILAFTDAMHLKRYALYVFDYGALIGFRLAMARPVRITAIVSQNGNGYEEGLGEAWAPIRRYWSQPTSENRESIRKGLTRPSDISHATTGPGDHGILYTAATGLAGIFMLYSVVRLVGSASKVLARRVVHASVIYLPIVLGLMIARKG
jgi:pimeloyl-ACP methyl ester carboxylesterase